ncbi:MAG: glycosyltransferase [Collinsella sp.]|nr:glycosyltransferase [Collinsella sp.]
MSQGEPIRVAQVVGKMLGGGVEAVVMNYYRHIDRCKVQFDFLVDADSTLVPREEIESLGGRVFEIPPYQHVVEYQRELQRLFKQEGWKIVHSHINALSVFPLRAAKKAGVPVRIAHSHSTSGKGEYAKNALKAVLKTQSNRYPTHRFACSQFAGEWLFGKAEHFEVVYNAIDLDRFRFNAEARAQARADLGLVGVEAQVSGLPCLLSDAITREVDVTGECKFLPIDSPAVWADEIDSLLPYSYEGRLSISSGQFADYNIELQGKRLTYKYLDLYSRN